MPGVIKRSVECVWRKSSINRNKIKLCALEMKPVAAAVRCNFDIKLASHPNITPLALRMRMKLRCIDCDGANLERPLALRAPLIIVAGSEMILDDISGAHH